MQDKDIESTCWQVYMIEASDTKLYTGITTDIDHRWQQHVSGKGAKFFRGRKPKRLCYLENNHNKASASKREAEIKQLTRAQKLQLIQDYQLTSRENSADGTTGELVKQKRKTDVRK